MRAFRLFRLNPWREISILMLILMEVCWVTPWFRSLTAATYAVDPVRVFLIIFSMIVLSHLLIRSLDSLRLKKTVRQAVMIIFILITIFVGIKTMLYPRQSTTFSALLNSPLTSFADLRSLIPAEFIVIITVLVAVWRGLSIAQSHIGPSSVMNHFWLGIIMYVIFIFVNTLVTGETPEEFFYLFLFSSLVAMIAARMAIIGMLRGGNQNKLNRYWLLGMLLAALIVVGLSAVFGGFFGSQFSWISSLLLGLFGGTLLLFWIVLSPLFSLFINILQKIFNSQALKDLGASFETLNQTIQGLGRNIFDAVGDNPISRFLAQHAATLRTILFVSVIVLIIGGLVAWMAIQLWRDRTHRLLGGEQKTSLTQENLLQRILDLLRDGIGGAINSLVQLTDFNRRRKLRAAARIRQVYADLMELCDSLGRPRQDADTPLEFLPQLVQLFPALHLEAAAITNAYNCIRYGQLPETHQDVEEVESAWEKIQAAGREILASKKPLKSK